MSSRLLRTTSRGAALRNESGVSALASVGARHEDARGEVSRAADLQVCETRHVARHGKELLILSGARRGGHVRTPEGMGVEPPRGRGTVSSGTTR